jgi:hypothetical protein
MIFWLSNSYMLSTPRQEGEKQNQDMTIHEESIQALSFQHQKNSGKPGKKLTIMA